MIKSLSLNHSSSQEAIFLFNNIRVVGLFPDSYSFPFVLKAVSRVSDFNAGKKIHGQIIKCGFEWNLHVTIAIVQMYSSCAGVEDARKVFDKMSTLNDVALWNAMIAGYAGAGDMDNAQKLFDRMTDRNVISWTTMITGYVHVNQPKEAIKIFQGMQGLEVDEVAVLAALSACADCGALKLGDVGKALQVFESVQCKNVVSWTTIIVGLAYHGLGKEALEMFSRMESAGSRPNDITFIGILSACSHVGFIELGSFYFNSMTSKYGISPKIQHYGCMVDLLGRASRVKEAVDLVKRMPFNANATIWGSLLAAARMHQDPSIAADALVQLSVLEPENSGNYALVSNTYAAAGCWSEARSVRKTMTSSGLNKFTGESSIELNDCIRSFAAGAVSYPEAKEILEVLWEINQQCSLELCKQNIEEQLLIEECM
ncbi:unnamed protein product [Amaranthus hypochondriacus]